MFITNCGCIYHWCAIINSLLYNCMKLQVFWLRFFFFFNIVNYNFVRFWPGYLLLVKKLQLTSVHRKLVISLCDINLLSASNPLGEFLSHLFSKYINWLSNKIYIFFFVVYLLISIVFMNHRLPAFQFKRMARILFFICPVQCFKGICHLFNLQQETWYLHRLSSVFKRF